MIEEEILFFYSIDSVVHSIVFAVLLATATGRSILTIKILFYSIFKNLIIFMNIKMNKKLKETANFEYIDNCTTKMGI